MATGDECKVQYNLIGCIGLTLPLIKAECVVFDQWCLFDAGKLSLVALTECCCAPPKETEVALVCKRAISYSMFHP